MDKTTVRGIAEKIGLVNSASQTVRIYALFRMASMLNLLRLILKKIVEGNFLDTDGNIIGRHKGIINYTIGQRKGLEFPLEGLFMLLQEFN